MIDQPTIDRIIEAANIVEVVSDFVTLRKRGVNYVGLCPFHSDKSPSFYVSPAKNICKCFACGEGGTAVHFIMKHEQLSYIDSLRYLAKKYNIEIQERELTEREKRIKNDRESMLVVNGWAQQYFTSNLYETIEGKQAGLRYFAERGFREDTIRKFCLGYSLEQRDACFKAASAKGYRQEYLEKTGLIIRYDDGRINDRFRGRVMFPVHSLSGKIVAFGGRVLKKNEKTAKYVNSPESEVYHKSNELYGLYFAKQAIVKADRCYLVEGYTDVISMHQAGVENVVASSGTALTSGQIRLIHRFTNNITVLYDGDAAGIKAALRGIDMLLEEGMHIKVVLLPEGEDPDSFARSHNATQFTEFIKENETDFIRFKTRLLLSDAGTDPIKRSQLIKDIIRTIALIPDNIARSLYIHECSTMMEVDEQVVLNEVNTLRLKPTNHPYKVPTPTPVSPTVSSSRDSVEEPPVYPAQPEPDVQANDQQEGLTPPPGFMPPPPTPEELEPGTEQTIPTDTLLQKRSPYEKYELSLLRYIVRYGEKILFDYEEEETKEHVQRYVAEYIQGELAADNLTFYTPIFRSMLDEAAQHCGEEGFKAQRYFLFHPDPLVSQVAADLVSEKYQLSKYHLKQRNQEQDKDQKSPEEEQLDHLVLTDIYAFKGAYILQQITQVSNHIKEAQLQKDEEKIISLMQELNHLNKIKALLSKELGERIVIKI